MSRGLLPGLLVLSGKLGPTLRSATQRTLHSVAEVCFHASVCLFPSSINVRPRSLPPAPRCC